ncbi:MAG: beta strand repeat-containing protein [Prosthecobacter sp.]
MRRFSRPLSGVLCLWLCLGITVHVRVQADPALLTWDGTPSTLGTIDNTTGTWTNSTSGTLNWYNGTANQAWDPTAIALFGSLNSSQGAAITVNESITAAGINFLTLNGTLTGDGFTFSGTGSINLGTGATINLANNVSNSSGRYVRFHVPLVAHNLTVTKSDGASQAFFDFATVANPNLTGTLTLKTSTASGGVFAVVRPANLTGLSSIAVENGSTVYMSVTNTTVNIPMTIAGSGPAIRVDGSGNTFAGALTLSAHARLHTSVNVVTTSITAPITETAGGAKNFTRSATVAANSVTPITMTYSGASSYTGTTTFGVASSLLSTTDVSEGGTNVLNFASATAPEGNIFYNNVTPGALNLIGGTSAATVLKMVGAAGETNSQSFGGLSIQQGSTGVDVFSDTGGTAHLTLGAITRAASTVLAIKGPASGSISATYNSSSETFLGPWATYTAGDGVSATWASLVGGKVSSYTGNLDHATGTAINGTTGFAATSHFRVSSASTGTIIPGAATVNVATLSMTDTGSARVLDIGAGNTLRLAAVGGIQIVKGAQDLTVGVLGDTSVLTAGGTASNVAGELILTNLSSTASLTISSLIRNNGSGATTLILNGTGRTILTGANDFTGHVIINSGVLEARHSSALGAASASASLTKIMIGASLNLSGGVTIAEGIQVNGHGIASDGAIRSLSGDNILSGSVRPQSSTRISSDAGLLTLSGGIAAQTSNVAIYFSGAGNTEVSGLITGTTPILFKEGGGTLTLSGSSTAGGITTITNGALHLNFSGASAPATNILYTGTVTVGALSMSNGSTFRTTGKNGATNSQAFTTLTFTNAGKYTLSVDQNSAAAMNVNFTTISRAVGTIVQFDSTTLGGFTTTSGSTNALLTGTGGIAYATVGLHDWAATATANASRNIVGLSTIGGYTTASLSGNADVTASANIAADTAVTTLRFNTNTGGLLTLGESTANRYLTTGGILVTPAVGANDVLISTGGLRVPSGASELVIIQNNTQGNLRISSRITNSAAATPAATIIVKAGLGTVIIEAASIYNSGAMGNVFNTGGIRVQEGVVQYVSTLTSGSTLLYPVYSAADFTLGSGSTSAKIVIGSGTAPVSLWGGLVVEGSGTANSIVAGTTVMSNFTQHRPGAVRDFRKGIIGGAGTNENNLSVSIYSGTMQLGSANTYIGKTTLTAGVLEVEKLADTGTISSLGTGTFDGAASVIDLTTGVGGSAGSTVAGTLRYIGSTDSTTNRVVSLHNTGTVTNTTYITGYIENTGTGTLKFTSAFTATGTNTAQRTLYLGGTNTGDNSIVSMADATPAAAPGVKLEKTGVGTWIITGASTYSGGTTVTAGTLLVGNSSMVGSATGTGAVAVTAGATLGGNGRITAAVNKSITVAGGTLSVGIPSSSSSGVLRLGTSGTGSVSLDQNATLVLDLFSGIGLDNTLNAASADMLAVTGVFSLGTGITLKIANPNSLTGFTGHEQWKLFDWSGLSEPVSGAFASVDLPVLGDGLAWDFSQLLTTGVLFTVAVPEPSRALLLLASLGVAVARRRRFLNQAPSTC